MKTSSVAETTGAARHCIIEMQAASHSGMSGQSFGQQSFCTIIMGAEIALEMDARLGCANIAPTSKEIIKRRILNHMDFDMIEILRRDNTHCAEVKMHNSEFAHAM
jgi:hypothetical protein